MKTVDLLASLTRKEQRQFEQSVLAHHKRSSLVKLYQCLKKQPTIAKEQAYKKAFGKPYRPQHDTAFRNELRLLNKELEAFLIDAQDRQERAALPHHGERLLVKAYMERGQSALFEAAWRKLYQKATAEAHYALQVELIEWYVHYQTQTQEKTYAFFESLVPHLQDALVAHDAQYIEHRHRLETLHGYTQHYLHVISSGEREAQRFPSAFEQVHPLPNDDFAQMLAFQTDMHFAPGGAPKITLLERALVHSATLTDHPRYDPVAVAKIRATLALEHFICQNSEAAHALYQQLFETPDLLEGLNKPGLFYNYLSNLINLRHYQAAVDWYHAHEALWEASQVPLYRAQYLLGWAYLGLSQEERAHEALLAHDLQDRPRYEEFYARSLLSVVYFSLDDPEMAERETYNLLQNNRYKLSREGVHCQHVRQLHQFYALAQEPDGSKRRQKLQRLLENVEALHQAHLRNASPLFYRWLSEQLQQRLS